MELIPHIDIIEPERIEALFADPRNYAWRAVDCETLDTWSPDFGLTAYPKPSIYRASAVAASERPSTLRHRFWQTIESQADHTGRRYIGVLIYCKAGETCPMELRLASQDIGRLEPSRHDNRPHLIVVDKPVQFMGAMEVFRLTAPGPGSYRIEGFVLLRERPQPSRFLPEIANVTWRADGHKEIWQVSIHFTTSTMCSAEIRVEEICADRDKQYRETHVGEPARLHTLQFTDMPEDARFAATITARDPLGGSATETIEFSTGEPERPETDEVIVPLELIGLGTRDLAGLPLQFGLPLAKGAVYELRACTLQVGAERIPALMRMTKDWSDGSARWIMIHTQVPAGLSEAGCLKATVHINGEDIAPAIRENRGWLNAGEMTNTGRISLRERQGSDVEQEDENARLYLTASKMAIRQWTPSQAANLAEHHRRLISAIGDSGSTPAEREALRTEFESEIEAPSLMTLSDWRFQAVLGDGLALTSKLISRPQSYGEDSATFKVLHQDEREVTHLQSTLRLQFYPDQSFVKLHHRLEVISPALAPAAAGGELPGDEAITSAIVGEGGEESTLLKLRSFSLHIPFPGVRVVRHKGEEWQIGGRFLSWQDKTWQLRHDHDLGYEIGGETRDGRTEGHIRVDGDAGTLGIGLRHFWQTYPKAISVGGGGVDIELFPERGGVDLPGDEDAPHRLYFWLADDGYILKAGMALSNEILLDFGGDQPAAFAWLEQGVLARPDIDYLNSTGALYPIGARRTSILPKYEQLADSSLTSFRDDREHFRAYGQINFGDWYGESGWSWGNNEYDPAYCAYTEFLRGGDPGWAAWAAESARHLADVDTINFSADPAEIGGQSMHMPGHLGGYLPPLFRSKMAGTKSIPSHTWVEGPMLHYLLTGDNFVYESLRKTRSWLLQKRFFDHYDFTNAREAGWHLIHLCLLAAAQDDPDCLNAASIIVERVLERAEPEGGWVRNLTESHCGCGYPRCRGEAGFMVGVLLSGLKRYYFLTKDPRVGEAILGGARWLIRETFDEESGHFRYTSCPNRTLGGNFRCTQWVLEGLAAAWELSGDADIAHHVKEGLPTIGMFPEWISHLGMGKAMSQQMRYVPTILATLESRPLL
ncbi:MAG: hypothetical protein OXG39_13525 [Chloroflexi bacterium]|nr:hypothetical protein [Chloroflexota bacterium]